MSSLMAPPAPGDPSYEQQQAEMTAILSSLKRRAVAMVNGLRKLEGVTCANPGQPHPPGCMVSGQYS